jgi:hypothetical protein
LCGRVKRIEKLNRIISAKQAQKKTAAGHITAVFDPKESNFRMVMDNGYGSDP